MGRDWNYILYIVIVCTLFPKRNTTFPKFPCMINLVLLALLGWWFP